MLLGVTVGLKQIGYIVLGVVLLCVVAWAANSFPRKGVVDDILAARGNEIKTEYAAKIKASEESMVKLRKEIVELNITISERDQAINVLKAKKFAVKKPKTPQETVDAFTALGYPPNK